MLLRDDGEVLTGEAAERRALAEPTRTGREFKRRLGDPTPIILGGTPYGAEALLAHLLRSIVARVAEQSGEPPAAIALCHPASYGAYKLDLFQQAIRQADIGPVELLTEPEAAALYYARQERVPVGSVIAVYDFGGGTFDATILRKTEDGFEALGQPEGLERLGGIDFDEALFRRVMGLVAAQGVQVDANDPSTLAALARLREECRRAKEALSSDTDATIPIFLPGIQTELRLTRSEFEDSIRPRIHETIEALGRATRSAGLGFEDVDRVLLVGGSSRIPLVAEMVREATGRPVAVDAHPKHTMALGAAFVAESHRQAAAVVPAAGWPLGQCLRPRPVRQKRWRRPFLPRWTRPRRRCRCRSLPRRVRPRPLIHHRAAPGSPPDRLGAACCRSRWAVSRSWSSPRSPSARPGSWAAGRPRRPPSWPSRAHRRPSLARRLAACRLRA